MLDDLARRLYERLGARYKVVFLATQIPTGIVVALVYVGLLASFYEPPAEDLVMMAIAASVFTSLGIGVAIARQRTALVQLAAWPGPEVATPQETAEAWDAATNFTMRSFRRDSLTVNSIAAIPSLAVTMVVLDLSPGAIPALLASVGLAAAWGTMLTYSIAEFLMRPPIAALAQALPEDFAFTRNGLPVRKRLIIAVPTFTATAGLVVAAVVTEHGGTRMLGISVTAAILVSLLISMELTVLLSRAITDPIVDLRKALQRVSAGDLGVQVPVMSSDDLGELSDAFNRMVRGLAEREQLREAFGTYLDRDVAELILSGRFPAGGAEVEVTVMFCDVPGFTSFAERSEPAVVVAALNDLFELLVPIVTRHGGHVDKFLGDGMLAVFGAPEGFADHADRALAAGREILDAVGDGTAAGLTVGVGLNTGRVVAGSIGGAGRLNFSVIGDAVNVAARVEAATRDLPDDLLLTCSTRDALQRPATVVSRGSMQLKGKAAPVELFAPDRAAEDRATATERARA